MKIRGQTFEYSHTGTGCPAIVVGMPSPVVRTVSDSFKQHFRLYYSDLYFVNTDEDVDQPSMTMDSLVDDVETFRLAIGHAKLALVAHSGFGLIALSYALKYPEKTEKLILFGTPPFVTDQFFKAMDAFYEKKASEQRKAKLTECNKYLTEEVKANMTRAECWIAEYNANFVKCWYNMDRDYSFVFKGVVPNMCVIDHLFSKVFPGFNISQRYNEIQSPIFLALGKSDFVVPFILWSKELLSRFQNIECKIYNDCGHYAMAEAKEFEHDLETWCRSAQVK